MSLLENMRKLLGTTEPEEPKEKIPWNDPFDEDGDEE